MSVRVQLRGVPEVSGEPVTPGRLEVDINGDVVLEGTPASLAAVAAAIQAIVTSRIAEMEDIPR